MSWRERQRRLRLGMAIAYAAVGVVTFGRAAAAGERAVAAELAECRAVRTNVCVPNSAAGPLGGLFAAALWPLYWSWEAWS